ncbi:MAG: S41 family peptidase [Mobilitalea sp.]
MEKRLIKVIGGVVIAILLFCIIGFAVWKLGFDPYREAVSYYKTTMDLDTELSKEQVTEDLGYLMKQLKKYHPAYLDGSEGLTDAVDLQYQEELLNLREGGTVLQLWQAAARIASKFQDGHTNVYVKNDVVKYLAGNEVSLADMDLISIDGVTIEDLYSTFCNQFSYELDSYAAFQFRRQMIKEEYMRFLNIDTSDGVDITYFKDRNKITTHYEFKPQPQDQQEAADNNDQFVTYEINQEKRAAIFTLSECNYNNVYLAKLEEFFNSVFQNNIKTIIVDLRINGGGNSEVANAFLNYIDVDSYKEYSLDMRLGNFLIKNKSQITNNNKNAETFKGDIYILTSSKTFSSATMFGTLFSDNKLATIVGETSGNMPSSYGDVLSFQLPNSRLCLGMSYKKFHRPDITRDKEPLTPDIEVESEKALDTVLEMLP